MVEELLDLLFDGLTGNKVRRSRQPRDVSYGDVVCVDPGLLQPKRYGIWTGKNFILYGEGRRDKNIVHEETFRSFLGGAEHFAICEFPEKYGRPTHWKQPVSSSFMPRYDMVWRQLEEAYKAGKYKRYSPHETVSRARSRLGTGGYRSSESFAMWCKTGISELRDPSALRWFGGIPVVYTS